MYAQKIEGESWRGEKIDKGKIDKMSGSIFKSYFALTSSKLIVYRSAARPTLRADASHPEG